MTYYEAPWDRRPSEIPGFGVWPSYRMVNLDHVLPAIMDLEGWHFRAWELRRRGGSGSDPYYLYAPDGTLVGRWETEPTLSDLYDCWRQWPKGVFWEKEASV